MTENRQEMITLSSRKTLSFTPSIHEIESIFQEKISVNLQTSRISGSIFVSSGSDFDYCHEAFSSGTYSMSDSEMLKALLKNSYIKVIVVPE